jgi:hypothetical protein
MKNKSRKYKLQSGVQKIAMDTRDDSKAYKLQEEEGAKQQAISQGLGAISGNFKPVADVGDIAGSVVKSNFKTKGGAQLGGAISKGAAGAAAGAQIGSIIPGVGTGIGAAVGGLAGIGYGVFSAGNEYDEGKRLQNEADRVAAWKEYQKGYNTNGSATDAQAKVAKKGMYKVKSKQPREIETEGREPIFSPKDKNGKRKLLYYNPNDPTHEEGGVRAMVIPKKGLGTNMLMPKRPSVRNSLVMAYGNKQLKVDNINDAAFNGHLTGQPPVNAANNFMQPRAGIMQVARNIPEDRRKEKIRTERSHKKSNPDANKRVNPPLSYEMKPPAPRSTFNTKNDFKNGGKAIKAYSNGTEGADGTQAGATYKHTKKFGNRQDFQNALAAHDDSLALHGQSRFFEDAVNIGRKYHPTVEVSAPKIYKKTGKSQMRDPNIDPLPSDYIQGAHKGYWGNLLAPTFENISSKDIQPIKTNTYTRKESTYKSEKEYYQKNKSNPSAHGFWYDVSMYKHPEMRPVFEPDTVNPIQGRKAKLSTSSDTVTTRKPVKPVIVPTTPIITPIKVPTRETPRDTTSTRTTPVVATNPTVTPARSKFLGKEKTGLQKLAEGFINKVGSSTRMSNGKRVRVAK